MPEFVNNFNELIDLLYENDRFMIGKTFEFDKQIFFLLHRIYEKKHHLLSVFLFKNLNSNLIQFNNFRACS